MSCKRTKLNSIHFAQLIITLSMLAEYRDPSTNHLGGQNVLWTGTNTTGRVVDANGTKKGDKNHRYCQLCLENGCHTCVCSVFQVIKTRTSQRLVCI